MATFTAEPRKLIVNDLLCYFVNKYSKVAGKPLKSTIVDFYSADDISAAKETLHSAIDELKEDKMPKMIRRRKDSINRTFTEVDDMITTITLLDEAKVIDRLPLFVSADPDKMPSVKLTDGDMAAVMLKLAKLEEGLMGNVGSEGDMAVVLRKLGKLEEGVLAIRCSTEKSGSKGNICQPSSLRNRCQSSRSLHLLLPVSQTCQPFRNQPFQLHQRQDQTNSMCQ